MSIHMDFEEMGREELMSIKAQVESALSTLEQRRRDQARRAVEQAAKEHGFSLDEVLDTQKKSVRKNPAKYRNPENPRQTWTGRGRQPAWIKEGLNEGKNLKDFAI